MYPNWWNTTVILIVNLLILLYAYLLNKKLYKSFFIVSLPFLFSIFFFFFYIIVHSYVVYSDNIFVYYSDTKNPSYMTTAAIFATMMNFFFNIGVTINAFLKSSKHIPKIPYIRVFNSTKLFKIGLIIFIIGISAKFLYFVILGHGNPFYYILNYFQIQLQNAATGGSFSNYLNYIFIFIDIGADLILFNYLKYKRHKKITICIILLSLLCNFNVRMSLVRLILQYLTILFLVKRNSRKIITLSIVFFFIPMLCLFVISLGIYRDFTNNPKVQERSPIYFLLGSFHPMKTLSDRFEYKNIFGEKYYGKTIILPAILKPIPRKIWKNKQLNAAAIYTKTMRPGAIESGFAIAPGIGFDLLINFGVLGSLLVIVLWGILLSKLQNYLYKIIEYETNNLFPILIMAILCAHFSLLRGADISSIPMYLSYYVPILVLLFVKFKVKI